MYHRGTTARYRISSLTAGILPNPNIIDVGADFTEYGPGESKVMKKYYATMVEQ